MAAELKSLDEMLDEKVKIMMEKEREQSRTDLIESFNRIFSAIAAMKKYSPDDLLDEKQLAEYLGVTISALQSWRNNRKMIPFIKLGGKTVRYKFKDVVDFLNSNQVKVIQNGRVI